MLIWLDVGATDFMRYRGWVRTWSLILTSLVASNKITNLQHHLGRSQTSLWCYLCAMSQFCISGVLCVHYVCYVWQPVILLLCYLSQYLLLLAPYLSQSPELLACHLSQYLSCLCAMGMSQSRIACLLSVVVSSVK